MYFIQSSASTGHIALLAMWIQNGSYPPAKFDVNWYSIFIFYMFYCIRIGNEFLNSGKVPEIVIAPLAPCRCDDTRRWWVSVPWQRCRGKTLPVNFGLFATPVFYSSATAGITFRLHLIMTNKLTFYLFYSTLYDRILDCYWNIEFNGKDEHLW